MKQQVFVFCIYLPGKYLLYCSIHLKRGKTWHPPASIERKSVFLIMRCCVETHCPVWKFIRKMTLLKTDQYPSRFKLSTLTLNRLTRTATPREKTTQTPVCLLCLFVCFKCKLLASLTSILVLFIKLSWGFRCTTSHFQLILLSPIHAKMVVVYSRCCLAFLICSILACIFVDTAVVVFAADAKPATIPALSMPIELDGKNLVFEVLDDGRSLEQQVQAFTKNHNIIPEDSEALLRAARLQLLVRLGNRELFS